MDMEIQFFYENFTEKDPKLLVDHIKKMAAKEAPFFGTTLSLVLTSWLKKHPLSLSPPVSALGSLLGLGILWPPVLTALHFLSPTTFSPTSNILPSNL